MKLYKFGFVLALSLLLSPVAISIATLQASAQDQQRFFIAGEVNKPGQFEFKEGITIRRALTFCEGTTSNADLSRAIIFREDQSTGKRREIAVDLAAVMTGRNEDVSIQQNDVVIVPKIRKK